MPSKAAAKKTTETPVVEVTPVDTKKTTRSTKSVVAAEPVPVVAKKETKPRGKKDTTSVETTTPETPVVENVVVAVDSTETSITDHFTEFIQKFQGMLSQFSSLKTELRNLERKTVKQMKIVQKLTNKKRKKGTRAPSGFVKPSLISDELATFLGRDKGSEMARTDVTREINKYIRANNLQDKENGRKINADAPLKVLLKIDDEVELTYFNLQRYMGPHFPKQAKAVPPVEAVA
jgi:chromatin remodeling complex protein RSC6